MDDLLVFLEIVCDGQWNLIPGMCEQRGVDVDKLCDYVAKLAEESGIDPPFTREDF